MEEMYMLDFQQREDIIFSGLKRYINGYLGEYLTQEQSDALAEIFKGLRMRPANVSIVKLFKDSISEEKTLRHRHIPSKTLRKDECAIFFYNVAPYALLNRNQTARLAKHLMPNFFASEGTINSTFTKYLGLSVSELAKRCGMSIANMPTHTTAHVERVLFGLVVGSVYLKIGLLEKLTLGDAMVLPSKVIEALYSVVLSPSLRVTIITDPLPLVSISEWMEKGSASTA